MLITVTGNHYPVGDGIEYVRHVAQMRDREHRVQQFPLSSVLSSLSRQNARPELDLEVAIPAFVTMQLRGLPSQTSTYSEGCTLFGHDSKSLTMMLCSAFGSYTLTMRI